MKQKKEAEDLCFKAVSEKEKKGDIQRRNKVTYERKTLV